MLLLAEDDELHSSATIGNDIVKWPFQCSMYTIIDNGIVYRNFIRTAFCSEGF